MEVGEAFRDVCRWFGSDTEDFDTIRYDEDDEDYYYYDAESGPYPPYQSHQDSRRSASPERTPRSDQRRHERPASPALPPQAAFPHTVAQPDVQHEIDNSIYNVANDAKANDLAVLFGERYGLYAIGAPAVPLAIPKAARILQAVEAELTALPSAYLSPLLAFVNLFLDGTVTYTTPAYSDLRHGRFRDNHSHYIAVMLRESDWIIPNGRLGIEQVDAFSGGIKPLPR